MLKKLSVIIQVVLALTALAGSVYVAFTPANSLMNWFNSDDAFFYYRVAANFTAGLGFSFDGINLTNGFHPLWMVVCICIFWLAKFSVILPLRVLVVVSGLFNAATAVILFRLLNRYIHPAAATVGAFLWALLPTIYGVVTVHGMETVISAFFLVLLISKASEVLSTNGKITPRQMVITGLIGVFAILARLDNVFLVAVVGLFLMFKIKGIPRLLIYDLAIIGVAMITSWALRFGLNDPKTTAYSIYPTLAIAILAKPICYYFCGMYEGFGDRNRWQKLLLQLVAGVINLLVLFVFMAILNHLGILKIYSRSLLVIDAILCSFLIFCLRLVQQGTNKTQFSPFVQFKDWLVNNWKAAIQRGTAFAAPIALVMGIYITFNKVVFGTFSPVSGKIKVWWNTLPNTVYVKKSSFLTLLGLDSHTSNSPWSLITSIVDKVTKALDTLTQNDSSKIHSLVFLGLFLLLIFVVFAILNSGSAKAGKKASSLLIPALFLGCIFQIAYYNLVGYQATRDWYWVAQMLTIAILVGVLFDPLFAWLDEIKPRPVWSVLVTVLAVLLICAQNENYISKVFPAHVSAGNEQAFLTETKEVEKFTEPGSKIGMTGGGLVGYFIQGRTIVNLDGLINSAEYFDAMQNGTAQAFLDAIPLNYVYGNSYMLLSSDPYREFLSGRLIEVGVIKGFDNFVLYKYEPNQ